MIRRRRPTREIAFSFDSFLDVVANVVGIILRLMIVAWVGARDYKPNLPQPPQPALVENEESAAAPPLPAPPDPLAAQLPKQQKELQQERGRLQEHVQSAAEVERQTRVLASELDAV